jgi:hypothetical protein
LIPTEIPAIALPTNTPLILSTLPASVAPNPSATGIATGTTIFAPTIVIIVQTPSSGGTATRPASAPTAITQTPQPQTVYDLPGGGGRVQYPPAGGQIIDVDVSVTGRRAIVLNTGQVMIDGVVQPYNADKKSGRFATKVRWSPDGRYLAFISETPNSANQPYESRIDDGVYVVDTQAPGSPPHKILKANVYDGNDKQIATDIIWARNSRDLLITVAHNSATGDAVVRTTINGEPNQIPLINFSNPSWLPDSSGFVATPNDGTVQIQVVRGSPPSLAITPANGSNLPAWIQNPVQIAEGTYAFLGGSARGGNLSLYLLDGGTATAKSVPLPDAVITAEWNFAHNSLLVRLRNGQVKVLTLDGRVIDVTLQQSNGTDIHWVR